MSAATGSPYSDQGFCHNCGSRLGEGTIFCPNCGTRLATVSNDESPEGQKRPHRVRSLAIVAVVLIIILVLAAFGGSYFVPPRGTQSTTSSSSFPTSTGATDSFTTTTSSVTQSSATFLYEPSNPDFTNGSADVSYPLNYTALTNYTLSLINSNRASFSVPPVAQSAEVSGQQHADSMDYHGTVGHWDTQGYKPYMRYTLLGGEGSLDENVAFGYCTDELTNSSYVSIAPCNFATIENAIYDAESAMMFNDSTCCDNGHRENILDPMHTAVSIGIAYNVTAEAVFLVEDFENVYLGFTTLSLSSNTVTLAGNYSDVDLTPWQGNPISSGASFVVFYDPSPQPIDSLPTLSCLSEGSACAEYSQCGSSNELNETTQCTYWGAYGPGDHLGAVFGPCPLGYTCSNKLSGGGTAVYASTWRTSGSTFDIQFSVSPFVQRNGTGVYTLYLYPNNSNETITSLSIFVS